MKTALRSAALLVALVIASVAAALTGTAGPYSVTVLTDPLVVPIGRATLHIEVQDARGAPVENADVRAIARMPGMFMGEREQQAVPVRGEPGKYTAPAQFPMAGAYEIELTIVGPEGRGVGVLRTQTGQSTGDEPRPLPWVAITVIAVIFGVIVWIFRRMMATGQRVDLRPAFRRGVMLPLLILAGALALSIYAVNNWRRPGAMDPIEAQIMDMAVPPPEGIATVTLATAELQPFAASIRYSGQVVSYQDQEILPRVAGVIQWMPFYVGDRVAPGQVLARLDTSQIDPMVAERAAGVSSAQEAVGTSQAEYEQALAAVSEARAEAETARRAVQEAQASARAVLETRVAALSDVQAAQADLASARADVAAADADRSYYVELLARARALLASGAISREEFQRDEADAKMAQARASQAQEAVRRAQAGVSAAQAAVRRTDSEIAASERRVQQMESMVHAQEAKIRTSQSGAAAAKRRIGEAQARVREAQAGLTGATTQRGYAEIRAQVGGVVTQRLISPGVLVQPGQAILRIARVRPIRIQANVPEADLARVRIGSAVSVVPRSGGIPVRAEVTSIQPSVEPTARTGVVEALVPNEDERFLPGQFVTMEILIGESQPMIVIPSQAIHVQVVPIEGSVQSRATQSFVWVADPIPGQSGRFTAMRRELELGDRSGGMTSVVSGLAAGEFIVVQGGAAIRSGQTVTAVEGGSQVASGEVTVEVTDEGYKPSTVNLEAGRAHRITFVRRSLSACGEELEFPALGTKVDLPLNEPVVVEIPARPEGELSFACGMDMLRGRVILR
jgi:RND family efflux transporter MFP subunit